MNIVYNEYKCPKCGRIYLTYKTFAEGVQVYCPDCHEVYMKDIKAQSEEVSKLKWTLESEKRKEEFFNELQSHNVIALADIAPGNDRTLFVIGNGFDLMHGVKSSYYSFRDSLGKHNHLRWELENYIDSDDLWADFETSLGKINVNAMASPYIVDDWLDIMDVYSSDDFSAADYFAAIDFATMPINDISTDLPRRFRHWVCTLRVRTEDRPLAFLLSSGKFLNFNYTEFLETAYGIPADDICYIHGCRKKVKGKAPDRLILGHQPGCNEGFSDGSDSGPDNPLVEMAVEQAWRQVSYADEALTKSCSGIIKDNKCFFDEIGSSDRVIVIGHSMSPVDWPYFETIAKNISSDADWYIGVHGSNDLCNLEALSTHLGVSKEHVFVFRTDDIEVLINDDTGKTESITVEKWKYCAKSKDGKYYVYRDGRYLKILHDGIGEVLILDGICRNAVFLNCERLLVLVNSRYHNVFLLLYVADGKWHLLQELKEPGNMNLLNNSFRDLRYAGEEIQFIYNNRIIAYGACDGILKFNRKVPGIGKSKMQGLSLRRELNL